MWTPYHKKCSRRRNLLTTAYPFLVNRGPPHLGTLKGTTQESQRFVGHVFHRQVLFHFRIRHLRDKTTPMTLRRIRKHQHLAARTRVVQSNSMGHQLLCSRPSLQSARRPRRWRNNSIFRHALRPPRSTRHQFFKKHTQGSYHFCHTRQRCAQPVHGLKKLH